MDAQTSIEEDEEDDEEENKAGGNSQVSTRILGRRTAPCPPFLIPTRVPRGFTQDPSTDRPPPFFFDAQEVSMLAWAYAVAD